MNVVFRIERVALSFLKKAPMTARNCQSCFPVLAKLTKREKEGLLFMEMPDILKSKSVKGFIKGSLVLIGLFAVLYCGVAVFLLNSGDKIEINKNIETSNENETNINNSKDIQIEKNIEISKKFDCKIFILFLILAIIPLIIFFFVFFKFSYFVKSYYKKLYGSSCDEGVFFKIKEIEMQSLERQNSEKLNLENKKLDIRKFKIENFERYKNKMQEIKTAIEVCKAVVKTIKPDPEKEGDILNKALGEMLEIFSKKCSEDNED
jgi:hypothetical protein